MPSMPGGDDKKEDDKAPETPEAKAEREQQVIANSDLCFLLTYIQLSERSDIVPSLGETESSTGEGGAPSKIIDLF